MTRELESGDGGLSSSSVLLLRLSIYFVCVRVGSEDQNEDQQHFFSSRSLDPILSRSELLLLSFDLFGMSMHLS